MDLISFPMLSSMLGWQYNSVFYFITSPCWYLYIKLDVR